MRGPGCAFCCCVLLSMAVPGHADETAFPYAAEVRADQLEVRCGPGWDYYVTSVLRRGDEVEVYRHEPGGWLAIRPPQGSFSQVAARHLTMTSQPSVAQANRDAVVAWVGSSVTRVSQHKWQVRLQQGERVEVLGQGPLAIGPGFAVETYYRIAPPSGEFRWIHARRSQSPATGDQQVAGSTIQLLDFQPSEPQRRRAPANWKTATRQPTGDGNRAAQVEQLSVDLGLLVSRPLEQWEFDSLRQRLAQLRRDVRNDRAVRQLHLLSERLTEFERLKQRYDNMLETGFQRPAGAEPGVRAAPRLLDENQSDASAKRIGSGVDPATALEPDEVPAAGSSFDAEGWLVPVHSSKRIAPPFAVLDDEGRVRCYASPMPGLNLRRHQRRHVGLYGAKRYVASLRAPHITVRRVVEQDRHRQRDD